MGVDLSKKLNGSFEFKQPYLIDRIIKALGFDEEMNSARNPVVKPPLHKDEDGSERKHSWHYRSLIGMLNYLENIYETGNCLCGSSVCQILRKSKTYS